jgi:hypothetical protein
MAAVAIPTLISTPQYSQMSSRKDVGEHFIELAEMSVEEDEVRAANMGMRRTCGARGSEREPWQRGKGKGHAHEYTKCIRETALSIPPSPPPRSADAPSTFLARALVTRS